MNTQTAAIRDGCRGMHVGGRCGADSQRDDERRCGGDQEAERGVDGITK